MNNFCKGSVHIWLHARLGDFGHLPATFHEFFPLYKSQSSCPSEGHPSSPKAWRHIWTLPKANLIFQEQYRKLRTYLFQNHPHSREIIELLSRNLIANGIRNSSDVSKYSREHRSPRKRGRRRVLHPVRDASMGRSPTALRQYQINSCARQDTSVARWKEVSFEATGAADASLRNDNTIADTSLGWSTSPITLISLLLSHTTSHSLLSLSLPTFMSSYVWARSLLPGI